MKNLFIYYFSAVILPGIILVFLAVNDLKLYFVVSLLIFVFVYRPFLDSYKLIKRKIISKRDIWKLVLGYGQIKWFRELYLKA
jgi:hypothetical protein